MGFKNLRDQFKSPGDRYIAEKRAALQPFLDMNPLKASPNDLKNAIMRINEHLPDIVKKKKIFGDENNKRAGRSGIGMSFGAAALLTADITVTGGAATLLGGSVVGLTGQFFYVERNHRFRKFYLEVQEKHDTFKKALYEKQHNDILLDALREQWRREEAKHRQHTAPAKEQNNPHDVSNIVQAEKPKRPRPVKKPLPPSKKGM